ncbi:hypothetical protein [Acinetobacter baumannii]|uniref:hypothetical protein n=1 Tax=Acinetobacter baumannii TaxID=470 RepID=UPI00100E4AEA|nr:hypothetical protein [Acinetobacter baumannii]NUG58547.1 hypothetical protein [Acinetobacter baumannii]QBA07097.1 hypothetical protein DYB08_17005 [Acinetobacter baumannii]
MFNEDEEKLAHENWYKNNDPIAYKFYRDLSPEFETDFYTSETAWLARAKAQAVPEGYVLLPRVPTEKMLQAYERYSVAPMSTLSKNGYKAMVEAASESGAEK